MTDEYKIKLIRLRDELIEASADVDSEIDTNNEDFLRKWHIFMAKLNHLAGFISAL